MIRVTVVYMLSYAYVVEYNNVRYLLSNSNIFFEGSQAFTTLDKLTQVYREFKQSNLLW